MSIKVENLIDGIAESLGLEWKGRMGHCISDDIERLLNDYYAFGTCLECRPEREARS